MDVVVRAVRLPLVSISMLLLLQVVILFETCYSSGVIAVTGFVIPSPPIIINSHKNSKIQLLPNDLIDITETTTTDVTNGLMTSMIGSSTTTTITTAMSLTLPNIPTIFVGLIIIFAGWLYIDGDDDRNRTRKRIEDEEKYNQYQLNRYKNAVLDYKEYWTLDEISQYDGTGRKYKSESSVSGDDENDDYYDDDGPILFAADGIIFNVYKGRNFYGPGGEYHIFAGRDATRLLAKTKVVEESSKELKTKLNIAERAALAAWIYTFKSKGYDIVGKLKDFDSSTTSMM
jgi:membrane-associated progesterone receptor component